MKTNKELLGTVVTSKGMSIQVGNSVERTFEEVEVLEGETPEEAFARHVKETEGE